MHRIDNTAVEVAQSFRVRNQTGVQLAAGKLVAVSGLDPTTGFMLVQLAENTSGQNKSAIGYLLSAIDHNADGDAAIWGLVTAVTTGRTIGDPVYLSTSGNFIFTAPTASARVQEIGQVAVVGASGKVFINPKESLRASGEIVKLEAFTFLPQPGANGSVTAASTTSATPQVKARTILDFSRWQGSGLTVVGKFYVFGYVASGVTGTATFKNITDNTTLATLTFTETVPTLKTADLANIPTSGVKVVEVQMYRSGAGAFTVDSAAVDLAAVA